MITIRQFRRPRGGVGTTFCARNLPEGCMASIEDIPVAEEAIVETALKLH